MSEEQWNHSFSNKEFVYGTEVNAFIKEEAKRFEPNSKIACLAEGEGRNAVHLANLGHNVTAYDISEVGLDKANHLARMNEVTITTKQINLIEEDLPHNAFDHAILVFGHVHKDDQTRLLNNMIKTVKSGGLIMFEVYSTGQINFNTGGPGKLDYLYDPQTVLDLIKSYQVLHFYYGETERFEGSRHTGRCHVIQVIIKK